MLRSPSLAVLLSAASLAAGLLASASPARADETREEAAEAQLVTRINAMRRAAGVEPLRRLEALDGAALHHSFAMARTGTLAHQVEGSADPGSRTREAGVDAQRVSENVSRGADANAAHQAILNSQAHREQLMNANYTHLGIGVVRSGDEVWVTQLLARVREPAPAELPPPSEEELPAPEAVELPAPEPIVTQPAPEPIVTQPAPEPEPAPEPAAQPTSAQNTVGAPNAVPGGRRIAGYWVFSRGRWWYFPLPEGARAGQELQPDLSVQGPPPGFSANPQVQQGQRMVVPRFQSGALGSAADANSVQWR